MKLVEFKMKGGREGASLYVNPDKIVTIVDLTNGTRLSMGDDVLWDVHGNLEDVAHALSDNVTEFFLEEEPVEKKSQASAHPTIETLSSPTFFDNQASTHPISDFLKGSKDCPSDSTPILDPRRPL